MSAKLTFKFQLSKHASLMDAGASLWVDTDRDGNIEEEDRIEMKHDDKNPLVWTAESELKVDGSTNVGFVMKFIADPEASWSLTVTSDEAGKGVVYQMKDRAVVKPFRQIMGWCS